MNSIQWCVSNLSNIVKQQQHHNRHTHTHTLPYNWIISTLYHIPYFIRICFMMLMLNATKNGAAQKKTKLKNSQAFDYDDDDRKRTYTTLCFVYFAAEDHLEKFEFTKCKSPWKRVNHKMNMKWCHILYAFPDYIASCFKWCIFLWWIFQPVSSIIIPFSCFILNNVTNESTTHSQWSNFNNRNM